MCVFCKNEENQTYGIIFLRLKFLCIIHDWTCAQIGTNSWISKSLNNSLFETLWYKSKYFETKLFAYNRPMKLKYIYQDRYQNVYKNKSYLY